MQATVLVTFANALTLVQNNVAGRIEAYLNEAQIGYGLKEAIYRVVTAGKEDSRLLGDLLAMGLPEDLLEILAEIILA